MRHNWNRLIMQAVTSLLTEWERHSNSKRKRIFRFTRRYLRKVCNWGSVKSVPRYSGHR